MRLLLGAIGLGIAAGAIWLLFALNRPGIEIKSSSTPLPTASAQRTTQPALAQATPTAIVAPAQGNNPGLTQSAASRPTQQPAQGPTQTPVPAQGAAPPPTAVIGTSNTKIQGYGVVTSKELNMRSAPNTDATVIKSLKSGEIVELISRNGGWYQTTDGLWISASFLEVRQTRSEAESYAREIASS